jgi:hypothetical protein
VSDKRFFVCHVYFRSPSLPRLNNFVTFAVAGSNEEAEHQILSQLQANMPGEALDIVEMNWAPVKREVLEHAATEVLGWKAPEN